MKIAAYLLALVLGLLGLVFIAGNQGLVLRIVVGVVLLLAAGTLVALTRLRPVHTTHTSVQKIDLSGDVRPQDLKCSRCGGHLDENSVSVRAGAVFVSCPYCKASYQLEEAPKW